KKKVIFKCKKSKGLFLCFFIYFALNARKPFILKEKGVLAFCFNLTKKGGDILKNKNRILVCSDIHGEFEKLQNVLEEAEYDPIKDQLILLGDYIDRGPKSKEVVEYVMELVGEGSIALI